MQLDPSPISNTFVYHNISNRFNIGINNISPTSFKKHIEFYRNLNDVTLCFDDAYEDIFTFAYPLINKENFKKIIFPITDYIGSYNKWDVNFFINKKKHVNDQQIKELSDNGWVIGSHGASHISYRVLTDNQIYNDLCRSKEYIEKLTVKEADVFTPPFGYFRESFIDLVAKAGYKKIYLNSCYFITVKDSDLEVLQRHNIYKHDTISSINRKINNSKLKQIIDTFIHYCSNATVFVKKIT